MKRLHLVGHSGHGKTTLIEELVRLWSGQGMRIATVKHSPHHHETDMPGKDSWRHHQAGSVATAFIAGSRMAIHRTLVPDQDAYALAMMQMGDVDLVLVEGGLEACAPKVEVWRQVVGGTPLAVANREVSAVISNDTLDLPVPIWRRNDVPLLANHLMTLAGQ